MKDYLIVTDSSCDLACDFAEQLGVKVIKLEFIVEGEEARANDGIDEKQFYDIECKCMCIINNFFTCTRKE